MVPVPSSVVDADSSDDPFRLTADDPLSGLSKWLSEGRVDAAATARARQRWLERQATEDATLAGVLLDLGERSRRITVRTEGGTNIAGSIVALGADFVIVREDRSGDAFIPLGSVATVRGGPGDDPPVGDRSVALAAVLGEVLGQLAADGPTVKVVAGGDAIRGDLRSVGQDLLAVEVSSERREVAHVALHAIDHLILLVGQRPRPLR